MGETGHSKVAGEIFLVMNLFLVMNSTIEFSLNSI